VIPNRVIVAGAGPAGLLAATVLVRNGVPVVVVEAGPGPSPAGRSSTLMPSTLGILDGIGLTDRLLDIALVGRSIQYRKAGGAVIADLDLDVLTHDTRFPYLVQCEQATVCALLWEKLESEELAELLPGHRVVGVTNDAYGVVVNVETADGPAEVAGTYAIAADGTDSVVRGLVEIGFDDPGEEGRFVIVSTTFDLREVVPDLAYVTYVADRGSWVAVERTAERWRVTIPLSAEVPDDEATSDAYVGAALAALFGHDQPIPVDEALLFRAQHRIASTFRRGRVLLAGNAAHETGPIGALGLNLGLHDAVSAARRLSAVVQWWDEDEELDWYERYRKKVAEELTEVAWLHTDEAAGTAAVQTAAADSDAAHDLLMRTTMLDSARTSL